MQSILFKEKKIYAVEAKKEGREFFLKCLNEADWTGEQEVLLQMTKLMMNWYLQTEPWSVQTVLTEADALEDLLRTKQMKKES